jgi:hypothetical protein
MENNSPVTSVTTFTTHTTTMSPEDYAAMKERIDQEEKQQSEFDIYCEKQFFQHNDIVWSETLKLHGIIKMRVKQGVRHFAVSVQTDQDQYYGFPPHSPAYTESPHYKIVELANKTYDWLLEHRDEILNKIQTEMYALTLIDGVLAPPYKSIEAIYKGLESKYRQRSLDLLPSFFTPVKVYKDPRWLHEKEDPYEYRMQVSFDDWGQFNFVEQFISKQKQIQEYRRFVQNNFVDGPIAVGSINIYPPEEGQCMICNNKQENCFIYSDGDEGGGTICSDCISIIQSHFHYKQ